jgi:uncharacterized Zn-binding protein involved in type VI secretion
MGYSPVARQDDIIYHEDEEEGTIVADCTVLANGISVARIGDGCSIHGQKKLTQQGSSATVLAENIGVARIGTITSCDPPGIVISGSPNVLAND